jgi:hypothetical protein
MSSNPKQTLRVLQTRTYLTNLYLQDLFSDTGTQANVSHSPEYPHPSIPISTHAASAALDSIEKKPKFSEFLCDPWRVQQFVLAVIRDSIPRDFWGSKANAKVIENREWLNLDSQLSLSIPRLTKMVLQKSFRSYS